MFRAAQLARQGSARREELLMISSLRPDAASASTAATAPG